MVRSIAGHGLRERQQAAAHGHVLALVVRISALMPGNGCVADPGLVRVMPGSGVIMMQPVSVCHQVSTIGQRCRRCAGDTRSRLRG